MPVDSSRDVASPFSERLPGASDAAGGGESPVYGDDNACYEAGSVAGEPDGSPNQFIRFSETAHWRMINDLLTAFGQDRGVLWADRGNPGPCFSARSTASQRVRLSTAALAAE